MFATGVTVITTLKGEQVHGMTANAFMSVSLEPPLVLSRSTAARRCAGCSTRAATTGSACSARRRARSPTASPAGPATDCPAPRFDLVRETPLVDGALAHFVARVERSYWGGDHSLFLGRVEYARHHAGTPLLFHGGRYAQRRAARPARSCARRSRPRATGKNDSSSERSARRR